jgi:antitoxin MazE
METKLIRIGNSKGVRFSKAMLQQTGISDRIQIEAVGNRIIVTPAQSPRTGWVEAFAGTSMSLDQEDLEWLNAELSSADSSTI